MVGVEERLAHVEGFVAGHAQLLGDLRSSITRLDERMERRFAGLEGRMTSMDAKFDSKIDALDRKLDERFRWMLGLQMTLVAVVLASILAR